MATHKEPTVDVLLSRFSHELQKVLYPFFIVATIAKKGNATRQEIWEDIFAQSRGAFSCAQESHNQQISRMEKTFGLIEPIDRNRDSTLVRYRLTDKGERLYLRSNDVLIDPLRDLLQLE